MNDELNTLITGLYVIIDDEIVEARCVGRPPQPTDAELVALAVLQALPGFHSQARWLPATTPSTNSGGNARVSTPIAIRSDNPSSDDDFT